MKFKDYRDSVRFSTIEMMMKFDSDFRNPDGTIDGNKFCEILRGGIIPEVTGAKKGGYYPETVYAQESIEDVVLDPAFWQELSSKDYYARQFGRAFAKEDWHWCDILVRDMAFYSFSSKEMLATYDAIYSLVQIAAKGILKW